MNMCVNFTRIRRCVYRKAGFTCVSGRQILRSLLGRIQDDCVKRKIKARNLDWDSPLPCDLENK